MITGAPAGYPAATLQGGSSSRVGGRVSADGSGGASDAEAREFAAAFRSLLEWVHAPETGARNEVAALVQRMLGDAGTAESVVTRQLPPFEQVNLQTALNAWAAQQGRQVEVRGTRLGAC